jgi:hypothetical protein
LQSVWPAQTLLQPDYNQRLADCNISNHAAPHQGSMRYELVEQCDGFKVVKVPAMGTLPAMYAAEFNRRPK